MAPTKKELIFLVHRTEANKKKKNLGVKFSREPRKLDITPIWGTQFTLSPSTVLITNKMKKKNNPTLIFFKIRGMF